jgi:molybdopterin/thiamine biosynthesis adenylyltransferase
MNNQISQLLRFDRQGFLGPKSGEILDRTRTAVIGLGGGGSHINQQLAHLGVGTLVLIDPDIIEGTNLNRLVGATEEDVARSNPKTLTAERLVRGVNPWARITSYKNRWQQHVEDLKSCTVIFGCVDSITERDQIESFARRHLIPYIDIGMDVHPLENGFSIGGQVAVSIPGLPCLRCMGIITDQSLEEEARQYGAAGSRPQVIWPNGVLASTAIGMFVKLITPWEKEIKFPILLEYHGDAQTLLPSSKLQHLENVFCTHFTELTQIGNPFWELKAQTV